MPKESIDFVARRVNPLTNGVPALTFVCCLLLVGCTLGPRQLYRERQDYNQAVQQSFREEMLLNLVRLRYRETPEFLSVGGIAAQYTFDGSASGGLTLPERGTKIGSLSGRLARTERPTVSYVPARGAEFQKGLLAPIHLQTLELLTRTGWSWERIFRVTVQFMNRVDNATSAGGPTPELKPNYEEFQYLAQLMRQLQVQRAIELASAEREATPKRIPLSKDQLDGSFVIDSIKEGYRFKETDEGLFLVKDQQYVALIIHPRAKVSSDMQEIARLLDLEVDYDSPKHAIFEVESGKEGWIQSTFANSPSFQVEPGMLCFDEAQLSPDLSGVYAGTPLRKDIVVSTRSILEVMFYLSQGVTVPLEHQAGGLVTLTVDDAGEAFDWSEMMHDLFIVRACKRCPEHAAVAVRYRDYWFYIDERDQGSLSTFTLLIELFGIEVQAGGGGGFLYTLGI